MKKSPLVGVREDRKTGQYVPTVNGVDVSPTSFDRTRALAIAAEVASQTAGRHTPGPWAIFRGPEDAPQFTVYGADPHGLQSPIVCDMAQSETTARETEANARLISAAPELLAALLECLPYVREEMEACADLRDEEGDAAAEAIDSIISKAEAAIAKATATPAA